MTVVPPATAQNLGILPPEISELPDRPGRMRRVADPGFFNIVRRTTGVNGHSWELFHQPLTDITAVSKKRWQSRAGFWLSRVEFCHDLHDVVWWQRSKQAKNMKL
jgi:hypothetical protein